MKKIITLFIALCMVLPALNAQNNKALNKALKKEYKVKISLRLSGREKLHAESAVKILDAFADYFEETAIVEKKYGKEQVQKFVLLSPKK